MTRLARLIFVVLALLLPTLANAHAQFKGSDPSPNALVLDRPEAVVLRFSEPVSPVAMRWISPAGESFQVTAEAAGAQVSVPPPPEVGDGSYLLAWRVVSLDGHPVGGTLVVSVGVPSELPSLSNIDWPPISSWAVIAMKFLLSMSLAAGVGGAVYGAFVSQRTTSHMTATRVALVLVFPAALLLVGAQGLDLLGLSLGGIFAPEAWSTGAGTSILRTALMSAAAAGVALTLLIRPLSQHRGAAAAIVVIAWGLAATSFAVSGHTATAEPEWQAVTASIIHGIGMIFWVGAFLPILGLIRGGDQTLPELRRFSTIAMPLVTGLIVSGFFMASIHAGSGGFRALGQSGYGILLFVKVVSAIGLVLVAAHNRLVLTPAVDAGTPGAAKALRGSIHVEIILAMMIVAFASSFRLTPPPQTQVEDTKPQTVEVQQNNIEVQLKMTPGLVGPNVAELSLRSLDDTPLAPLEVTLGFAQPEMGIGPIEAPATPSEVQEWVTAPVVLPLSGTWQVTIELLVTDFDLETLTTDLEINP